MTRILSEHQRAEFEASGILKMESLISKETIIRACSAILSRFEALNLSQNGEWQLEDRPRLKWPDKGYSTKQIGNKIEDVESLLDEPVIRPIIDDLLEHADLDKDMFKRPQILVTLPNKDDWFMPSDGWHVDIPRLASGDRAGVQIFILLDEIKPQGGGTLAVAGSHQLLNRGDFIRSRDVTKQLRKHPFFHELMLERHSSLNVGRNLDGTKPSEEEIELAVIEMTGAPGDAYLMDTRVIHSGAPNVKDQPRMMATHRFVRADAVAEMRANQ
ncbi:MAG: phytanoyl-CoA dioxygenase family protein [Pseudomonadota bacterium]